MLKAFIIKQEDRVMFLTISILALASLASRSDRLIHTLLLELMSELLTTILIPHNIL